MARRKVIEVPMVPIRDVVVFPKTMFPFIIGRESSIQALQAALEGDRYLFLATQRDPAIDNPSPRDIYPAGTLTLVVQNMRLPEGNIKVLVEGICRARMLTIDEQPGYFRARVELHDDRPVPAGHEQELRDELSAALEEYVKINPAFNLDAAAHAIKSADLNKLADGIAHGLPVPITEKQDLLETLDPRERLTKVIRHIRVEIEKNRIDRSVQNRVKEQMDKAQREYYLHEKIKAIQKELGEEGLEEELERMRQAVVAKGLTEDAADKARKEIGRLAAMPPSSAEAAVSRHYIDWLLSLPWQTHTRENRNLTKAEAILEADHYGLEKIKERILEFLAVRTLSRDNRGSILCFVGPPGVGKTSLGRSIARATARKFVRLSLGGVRDEAEIRGHRRTYIGSFPGQIIQMMKKAGARNPVFLLDELDKMSSDFRGDPAAALLEVLDPEQNSRFVDHYIDTEFDLSQVMFVGTANTLHLIPRPLQDRMEIIELSGYTEREKLEIARRYLLAKQLKACGLKKGQAELPDETLLDLVRLYTRESGVRNLEREIGRVLRKVARRVLTHGRRHRETISADRLSELLGPARHQPQQPETRNEVGVALGMAWTDTGGEILFTEVTRMPGTGKLITTGKLGEVMRESARAALSYVRSRADLFRLGPDFPRKVDLHIHIPEGAIPKDGPSAGITLATAIVSLLTGVPVRADLAMTGEITLRGKVLPIGGVKEKVLAAHRMGLRQVILPEENRKDLVDIPADVREVLTIHLVETVDQVLAVALERPPQPLPAPAPGLPAGAPDGTLERGRATN